MTNDDQQTYRHIETQKHTDKPHYSVCIAIGRI